MSYYLARPTSGNLYRQIMQTLDSVASRNEENRKWERNRGDTLLRQRLSLLGAGFNDPRLTQETQKKAFSQFQDVLDSPDSGFRKLEPEFKNPGLELPDVVYEAYPSLKKYQGQRKLLFDKNKILAFTEKARKALRERENARKALMMQKRELDLREMDIRNKPLKRGTSKKKQGNGGKSSATLQNLLLKRLQGYDKEAVSLLKSGYTAPYERGAVSPQDIAEYRSKIREYWNKIRSNTLDPETLKEIKNFPSFPEILSKRIIVSDKKDRAKELIDLIKRNW